jgi:putative flippase GtrA
MNNIVAFFFSNSVAYTINVFWVFKPGRHKRIVEILMFFGVSAISMAIGTPIMGALIRYLGMTTTLAFGANVIVAVLVNYAARKFIIFKG